MKIAGNRDVKVIYLYEGGPILNSFDSIKKDWLDCKKCALAEERTQVVLGRFFRRPPILDDIALLLVVGEAPGATEDREGKPFVGPSGQVLDKEMLAPAGVRLAYITNLVGCRPPQNRDPQSREVEACSPRLEALVEAIRPDGIVTVGTEATNYAKRATWASSLPSVSILHPAYFLRLGHPTATTKRRVAGQAEKIKKLLVKLGQAVTKVEGGSSHDHIPIAAGMWKAKDGRTCDLVACSSCYSILNEPEA